MPFFLRIVLLVCVSFCHVLKAEDIELYVRKVNIEEKKRVLVVFDTSGSMAFSSETGEECLNRWGRRKLCKDHRLGIAQNALKNLIDNNNDDVDFGLMRFNSNNQGGYVVAGVGSAKRTLKGKINNLNANGGTPLSETLWEAYLYLSGKQSRYARGWIADKDRNVQLNQNYISPFKIDTSEKRCDNSLSMIIMTDGDPMVDDDSNTRISNLYNSTFNEDGQVVNRSYMPMLASAISGKNHNGTIEKEVDLYNSNDDIAHTAKIYTIGFGSGMSPEGKDILEKTAINGGGRYLHAKSAKELAKDFQSVANEVRKDTDTFFSPTVQSNNRDETQTGDSLYFTMFKPTKHTRWSGNLKKLKVRDGQLLDANGLPAIDSKTGLIKSSATTFWSDSQDGNDISKGGVQAQLVKQKTRNILSNFNTGKLKPFNYDEAKEIYGEAELAKQLGVSDDLSKSKEIIEWAMGIDLNDEDSDKKNNDEDSDKKNNDRRSDIFGDPLHSRPVSFDYSDTDTRVIVGTNAGMLHMFKDSGNEVTESWAFLPGSLLNILKPLKDKDESKKYYGMDGPLTIHFEDKDQKEGNKGIVNGEDKVYLFAGMRRGGHKYFALDITNPDTPVLLWTISNQTPGFEELGQTWSKPIVTKIRNRGDKPVVIFGAGYDDQSKDKKTRASDNKGRGLYIVDADDGSLIWSLTPSSSSSNNLQFTGEHSIAAEVSVLDTNYAGYVDRIYAADTGGGIWRVDMPNESDDSSESSKSSKSSIADWSYYQFANLGGNGLDDRRFFYKPTIARTFFTKVVSTKDNEGTTKLTRHYTPYEAILIGSGDRTNPLGNDTNEYLFSLRDENTKTRTKDDKKTYETITIDHLFDITNEPFKNNLNSLDKFMRVEKKLGNKSGWMYKLNNQQEKSLSKATVYNGVAYFTSFTPPNTTQEQCSLTRGKGSIYALHLHYGSRVYKQLSYETVADLPDTPSVVRRNKVSDDPNDPESKSVSGIVISVKGDFSDVSSGPRGNGQPWATRKIVQPKLGNGGGVTDGQVVTTEPSTDEGLKTHSMYIFKREENDGRNKGTAQNKDAADAKL